MGIKYKVFIGNIPSNIDETGLSQRLEKHGKIKSLKLRKTKSANFAVVLFASRKVNKSFLTYDKTDSDIFFENKSSDIDIRKTTSEKRELDIRKCGYPQRIKKSTRICVQNIPLSATDESLVSALKVFGQIKDCRIVRDVEQKSMGFGFVEFCEKKHNFKALIAKIVLENNLLKLTKVLPICLNDEKSLTSFFCKSKILQN
ncbi:hypothetical protein MHBO_002689 [Bonamia ostreae]|uniref:RRM domain-containing protein n=1 Tax=Bonamia ostreae TaxID=126728 RepID=A0ABV2ANR8_9EUKA